jgi:hypothetical protein
MVSGSGSGRIVINDRACHQQDAEQEGGRPGKPSETAAAANDEIILKKGDRPEDSELGVSPDVLQILE